jgi:beclin 1
MMKTKLSITEQKRKQLSIERECIMGDIFEARVLRDSILNRVSCMEYEINQVNENIQSVDGDIAITEELIEKNKQINIMNDAFYIWFAGPFATINSLRLGNLPQKPVDFTEINAALGIHPPRLCVCGINFFVYG